MKKTKIWIEKDEGIKPRGKEQAYWIYLTESYGFQQSFAVTEEEMVELYGVLDNYMKKHFVKK